MSIIELELNGETVLSFSVTGLHSSSQISFTLILHIELTITILHNSTLGFTCPFVCQDKGDQAIPSTATKTCHNLLMLECKSLAWAASSRLPAALDFRCSSAYFRHAKIFDFLGSSRH